MNWQAGTAKLWHGLWTFWDAARKFALENPLDPFPLKRTITGYNTVKARADVRAGVNVALLGFCQGMAFASMAGLPLRYGVMCSAVSALVGPWLASSRHTVLGPTNGSAFIIFSYFASYPHLDQLQLMPMLVFLVGAMLILGAYFRVADLAQYISRSVMVAYVTGASVMIVINQAPLLLGVERVATRMKEGETAPGNVFGNVWNFLTHLSAANWWALLVALATAGCYMALRHWRPKWPAFIISLLPGPLVCLLLQRFHIYLPTFSSGELDAAHLLPPFPSFLSAEAPSQFAQLFGLAIGIAFVANLENSVMAKTLASRGNYRVDPNQDMLSLGAANLACAYFAGMPASGSLTRSALNFESGARTAVSSLVGGAVCLIGALTLGPLIVYLPKAALATLVICIAVSLIHRKQIRICLRATKSDAFVFMVTFVATLLVPLHVAIFTGVGVAIMLYLRKAARPSLVEYEFNKEGNLAEAALNAQRQHPSISIVHVEGDLFFGAAELFRTQIQRTCSDPNLRIIILRLKNARHLDATSVMALEELVQTMRKAGRDLIISGAGKDVYRVLRDSGVLQEVGRENFFMGSAQNPNIATRNALKRAQQIIGAKEADVHIYYDPRHARKEEKT